VPRPGGNGPRGPGEGETDPYDFRAPGFLPDPYNSLCLKETGDQRRSASEMKKTAEELEVAFRERVPEFWGDSPVWGDSAVILYDGDLYIVGGYIRYLSERF
jgi:hypothetical protein